MACGDGSDAGREVGGWEPKFEKARKGAATPVPDLEEKATVALVVGGGQRSFRNHGVIRNDWQYYGVLRRQTK